jgi:multisubunit Na+/H+ antiporter MnhE subunit
MKFLAEKILFAFCWLAGSAAFAYFSSPPMGFGFMTGFVACFLLLTIMSVIYDTKEPEQYF